MGWVDDHRRGFLVSSQLKISSMRAGELPAKSWSAKNRHWANNRRERSTRLRLPGARPQAIADSLIIKHALTYALHSRYPLNGSPASAGRATPITDSSLRRISPTLYPNDDAMLKSPTWASLVLILAAVVITIAAAWIGGPLASVLLGGGLTLLGGFGGQWLTWVRERRFKVAELQRQAIYDLQDVMSEALRKLPDAAKANRDGQSGTNQSSVDFRLLIHELDKLSARVFDDPIKVACDEYKRAALSAFNDEKNYPSGYLTAESKLKDINTRVRELMPSLFEGR
jgi:hypothetical protein